MEHLRVPHWAERLANRLLPPTCIVCRYSGDLEFDLCRACRDCLPEMSAGGGSRICLACGDPQARGRPLCSDAAGRYWCPPCHERTPMFRRRVAPWQYAYPLDGLIGALKRGGRRPVARALGGLLATEVQRVALTDALTPTLPDLVIPVPDHPERRRRRGFSPTVDIAEAAATWLGVPCETAAAVRVADTGSLALRSRSERASVIRGAFRVDEGLHGRHVALVDDVLTTGATSSELARECLDTGVASLELWVLARTAAT